MVSQPNWILTCCGSCVVLEYSKIWLEVLEKVLMNFNWLFLKLLVHYYCLWALPSSRPDFGCWIRPENHHIQWVTATYFFCNFKFQNWSWDATITCRQNEKLRVRERTSHLFNIESHGIVCNMNNTIYSWFDIGFSFKDPGLVFR